MAESRRGQLRGKVIKRKLSDSVSVSSGSDRGSRQRSRSSSRGGGGAGITATVKKQQQTQVKASKTQQQKVREQARRGAALRSKQTSRERQEFDGDKVKSDFVEGAKGFSEEIKNFFVGGVQSELSRGSGVVFTSKGQGAIVDPKTKELFKETEKQITRDTATEKLFTGRAGEIDPTDPRTIGQLAGLGTLLAVPVGGKGVGRLRTGIQTKQQQSQVGKLEKSLNLEGQSEKLGKDTFITGGGTESRPESLFITRFGKKSKVEEVTPTGDRPQTLSPKDVTIFGKLDPTTQKAIKSRQEGTFRFKSNLAQSSERRVLQKGIFEGEIKEFAKIRQTELKNILEKKPERIFTDIKRPPSVFAATKAEKLEPGFSTKRQTGSPKTPFDTSPQSGGKTQTFTKEQTKLIKEQATPPKEQPKQGGLRTSVFPTQTTQTQDQQQILRRPPGTKPPGQKQDFAFFPIITPVVAISPSRKLDSLTPSKLKIREDIKLDLRRGSSITPDTGLKIRDDVTFRQGQRERPKPKLDVPEFPPPPQIIEPPPPEPPLTPGQRFTLLTPPPPRFGAGGDGGNIAFSRRRKPFVGNTLETQIVGVFNKPEINVGRTRTFSQKKGKKKKTSIFGGGKGVSISGNGKKIKVF